MRPNYFCRIVLGLILTTFEYYGYFIFWYNLDGLLEIDYSQTSILFNSKRYKCKQNRISKKTVLKVLQNMLFNVL